MRVVGCWYIWIHARRVCSCLKRPFTAHTQEATHNTEVKEKHATRKAVRPILWRWQAFGHRLKLPACLDMYVTRKNGQICGVLLGRVGNEPAVAVVPRSALCGSGQDDLTCGCARCIF